MKNVKECIYTYICEKWWMKRGGVKATGWESGYILNNNRYYFIWKEF